MHIRDTLSLFESIKNISLVMIRSVTLLDIIDKSTYYKVKALTIFQRSRDSYSD